MIWANDGIGVIPDYTSMGDMMGDMMGMWSYGNQKGS